MTRQNSSSRDRMVQAAATLLRERGLSGAGIQQVAERSRAPIGSVYHFFPRGKSQLVAEALQYHAEKAGTLLARFLSDKETPLPDRFRALCRNAAAGFENAGANKGCAIGSVSLDLDVRHEPLRAICEAAFDGWIAAIAQELPWSDEATRRSFAEMVVASIEGAFVLSRARRSGEPFITVGEWLATTLEQSATGGTHGSTSR